MKNPKIIKKDAIKSVVRAHEIVQLISQVDPHNGITLAELSKKFSSSKSTIFRYLQTLEQLELVEKIGQESYVLGSGVLQLSGNYIGTMSLPRLAEPFMKDLAIISQETVHLAVPSQNEVVYVGKVDGPLSIRMMATIGTRNEMYCTALGKAILAHLPEDRLQAVLQQGLLKKTPNTITFEDFLRKDLHEIQKNGYSIDNVENEEGVRCIGSAVFDYSKKLVGAISVSGPVSRLTLERVPELGPIVKNAAIAISRRMGYPL